MSILDKIVEAGTKEQYASYSTSELLAMNICTYKDFGELVTDLLSRMGSPESDEIMLNAVTEVLVMYIDEIV